MGTMRSLLGLALLLPFASDERAASQDSSTGLVLLQRQVDVTVQENLAIVRLTFKVWNPTDRTLEGEVTFQAPPGAAACDVSIVRNIPSSERRSKVMIPAEAAAIYEEVKRRDMKEEQVAKLSTFMATTGFPYNASLGLSDGTRQMLDGLLTGSKGVSTGSKPTGTTPTPTKPVKTPSLGAPTTPITAPPTTTTTTPITAPPTSSTTTPVQLPPSWVPTTPIRSPFTGLPTNSIIAPPSWIPTNSIQAPTTGTPTNVVTGSPTGTPTNSITGTPTGTPTTTVTAPPVVPDPAILEWLGNDTYRLRFFPVPATTDQTATVVLAFEVLQDRAGYALKIPLTYRSNFTGDKKTQETVQVSVSSRTALGKVASPSHTLATVVVADRQFHASAAIRESDREFSLRYALDAKAKPFDFSRRVNWLELRPSQERQFTATDAYCAVLGKRAIDALSVEAAEPSQRISNVSHVVSRHAALIVIERWLAREIGVSRSGDKN